MPGQLADRFADFQALGGIVENGREIVVEGLPASMRVAARRSTSTIREFNNVHLAIRWPDCDQRWQRGQKYVERWPSVIALIGVPQTLHGSPSRP